uniref:G-protein coupled receptors family 1 profile domain-containing protein n=1 Tax=Ficedula albicollis TaxID=59894 RepID=A0A803W859_FICAL
LSPAISSSATSLSRLSQGVSACPEGLWSLETNGVTLFICLCGLIGNGAVLWLLGFHIRRNPITVYILNLAVADFTFIVFMVASFVIRLLYDVSCSNVVSVTHLICLLLLTLFSYNMGLYLLTAISIERCSSILFPLWYRCRRPQHLSWVVCALLWALSIAVMVVVTASLSWWWWPLCGCYMILSADEEHCQVALISMYALNFLIFAPPMVISNVILFIKVLCGSKRRQPKRLYIVIFLTVLFFLIFGVPLSLWSFLQLLDYIFKHNHVTSLLLACANSSAHPLIYFLDGSCAKEFTLSGSVAFQRAFEDTIVQKLLELSHAGAVYSRRISGWRRLWMT